MLQDPTENRAPLPALDNPLASQRFLLLLKSRDQRASKILNLFAGLERVFVAQHTSTRLSVGLRIALGHCADILPSVAAAVSSLPRQQTSARLTGNEMQLLLLGAENQNHPADCYRI